MSNERRSSGLGGSPSVPPPTPETAGPPLARGLRASTPPVAEPVTRRAGLNSRPPPDAETAPASAPPQERSALRGDSLGPIPQMQKLAPKAAAQWIFSTPPDHFALLDIPQSRREHVPLSEWAARARKRSEELRHWARQNEEERQLLGLRAQPMIEGLERAVADDAALRRYFIEFGEGTVRRKAREFFENDQRLDDDEFGQLLAEATRWQVDESRAIEITREVVPGFEPPLRKRQPPKVEAKSSTWVPLVGRFRSSPNSLSELHESMVTEVPVAQELLASGLLSFHLSQQKEARLAQTADRIVAAYDRRESLMVWDFLWSTGYPFLHVIGLSPVDSLGALVAACDGRSAALVDPVRSGQLALWAERVAGAKELARLARPDRSADPREQARRALWFAGDRRLQLASGEVVASIDGLETAMLRSEAAAQAAVQEAASGSLFEWLRAAGKGEIAQALESLGRGRSALYGRYLLVWSSGRVRGLPIWPSTGPAHLVRTPVELSELDQVRLLAIWGLLEAEVLSMWASVLKIPAQAEAWSHLLATYRGRPDSMRVAALRWSVGGEGVLTKKGIIRTNSELFALFEETPSEVASLLNDGVIGEWARRAFSTSPLLAQVSTLPPPLQTTAAMWCLGYPTLLVGRRRIESLEALGALPDDARADLDRAITSGALAFWSRVRFPDRAPALAGPIDSEGALLAAGAPPATLSLSASQLDLGDILESAQRIENLMFVASGSRGIVSAMLRSQHPGVTLVSGSTRHRYGDAPLMIGPLRAATGERVTISVEVIALPNVTGDGSFEIVATNGVPPYAFPVRWQTRFPSGALALQSTLGLVGGGLAGLVFRPISGTIFDKILYSQNARGELIRALVFGEIRAEAVTGIGLLPGLVSAVFLARFVYNKRVADDPNGAIGITLGVFLFGLVCLMSFFGWVVVVSFAGVDMVGHRLRAIFGSSMSLGSSALLGWIVTLASLGAAVRAASILRAQERPGLARVALAVPVVVLGLLLVS